MIESDEVGVRGEALDDERGAGHSLVVGGAVGAVVFMVGLTAGMLALGLDWPTALGVALFEAFWGGLGFGVMVAGVTYISKHEHVSPPVVVGARRNVTPADDVTLDAATRQVEPAA